MPRYRAVGECTTQPDIAMTCGLPNVHVPCHLDEDDIYIVPVYVYNAVVHHFARTRMIGRAVPCPGCDWDGCVDCNPELVDSAPEDDDKPAHPEWLQPVDADAVATAIRDLEGWVHDQR